MTQEYKKQFLKKLIFIGILPLCSICMPACAEEPDAEAKTAQSEAEVAQTDVPATESAQTPVANRISEKDNQILSRFSYLGVALDSLPAATYCENSVPGVQAIYVREGSPAAQAGIRPGDILISLDGQKLFFPNQFSALVRSYKPGTDVEIVLLRGGEKMTKKATIGERCIAKSNRTDTHSKDDVRLYINGREISLSDGNDLGGWISLTPNGVLIRDKLDIPAEFRRIVNRAHAKLPDTQKVLSFLRRQYDDARKAALGKARQTFSQVFFGQGNSVIIVGDEKGRQVTVSRAGDDDILFRGSCTTQADIDKIPEEAKKIIDSFTDLKPMFEAELPEITDAAEAPPSE